MGSDGKTQFVADNQLMRYAGHFTFVINHLAFNRDQRITVSDAEIVGHLKISVYQLNGFAGVGKPQAMLVAQSIVQGMAVEIFIQQCGELRGNQTVSSDTGTSSA